MVTGHVRIPLLTRLGRSWVPKLDLDQWRTLLFARFGWKSNSNCFLWCLRIIFLVCEYLYKGYKEPPSSQRFIYTDFLWDLSPITIVSYLSLQLDALLSRQAHTEPPFLLHWKAWQPCLPVACCVCAVVCVCVCYSHTGTLKDSAILSANRILSSWWALSVAFVAAWASKSQRSMLFQDMLSFVPPCVCVGTHTQPLISPANRSGKESKRWSRADKGLQKEASKEKREEPAARTLQDGDKCEACEGHCPVMDSCWCCACLWAARCCCSQHWPLLADEGSDLSGWWCSETPKPWCIHTGTPTNEESVGSFAALTFCVYLCARHTRAHLSDQQGTGLFNLWFSFCYFFKTNIFIFSAVILCTVPFLLPPLASLMAAVVGRQKEFILSRVLSIFGGSFIISFFPQRRIYVCKKQKLLFVGILHRFMSNIRSFSFGLLS